MKHIYRLHSVNLGDHIATLGCARFMAEVHGERITVSTWNGADFTERVNEIESILDQTYSPIFTTEHPNTNFVEWGVWNTPPARVRFTLRWQPGKIDRIRPYACYQFDGTSSQEEKNPSEAEQEAMLQVLRGMGMDTIRLGAHNTLKEAAELLSHAMLFVGCDSGFTHMGHAVGTPVYIYVKKLAPHTAHKYKQYVPFTDPGMLAHYIEKYCQLVLRPQEAIRF